MYMYGENGDVNTIKKRTHKVEQAHVLNEGALLNIKTNVTKMRNVCKPQSWVQQILNGTLNFTNTMHVCNLMHGKNVDNLDIEGWKQKECTL